MVGIKKENKIDYEDFPEGPLDFWENYKVRIIKSYQYQKKTQKYQYLILWEMIFQMRNIKNLKRIKKSKFKLLYNNLDLIF